MTAMNYAHRRLPASSPNACVVIGSLYSIQFLIHSTFVLLLYIILVCSLNDSIYVPYNAVDYYRRTCYKWSQPHAITMDLKWAQKASNSHLQIFRPTFNGTTYGIVTWIAATENAGLENAIIGHGAKYETTHASIVIQLAIWKEN